MNVLNAWWALAGLLAVPIILLYLLKMRRRPIEVSSTLLWEQVLADLRANAPFQKLRRNLLMILQLLTLAVLVAALCQPVIHALGTGGQRTVLVIDASASMQATDTADGRTRFEHAVEQANRLIDSLRAQDRMMVVVAGPPGHGLRTPLTSSRGELHAALRSARPYDAPAATADALRLAASTLQEGGQEIGGRVYLLSDGVGVELPDVPGLEQALEYVRLGNHGTNVAITALSVEAPEAGPYQVVVGVGNFGPATVSVLANFYYGKPDLWITSRQVELEPGQQASVVVPLDVQPGRLWVRLDSDADALPLDDVGYVLLPQAGRPKVRVVTEGNPVLARFLAAGQESGLFDPELMTPQQFTGTDPAALTVLDGVAPPQLPPGDVLLINPPAEVAGFRPMGDLNRPPITNVRTEHEALRFVNVGELAIARARGYGHQGAAQDLIASNNWPLLAYTADGADRRYLLAFHLADSTWASDPGFLVLLSNLVERAAAERFVGRSQMLPTGAPARLPAGAGPALVVPPDGPRQEVPESVDSFAGTTDAGFYLAVRGDTAAEFAANLLSPRESDIQPRSLATRSGSAVAEHQQVVRTNRPLWPYLAVAALVVLMIEWYCYHRRVA